MDGNNYNIILISIRQQDAYKINVGKVNALDIILKKKKELLMMMSPTVVLSMLPGTELLKEFISLKLSRALFQGMRLRYQL